MLRAINLTKNYGAYSALDNLNLTVNKGEVFCLLGQNGAGKTTTINLFMGFLQPSSGKALVDDEEVGSDNPVSRQKTAFIPEVVMLYPTLTGLENLAFFSRIAGYHYNQHELESMLTKAGLQKDFIEKRVGLYSKGMRQKVGIAIALAKNAEAIFMDEPTSGLDPKATAEFTILIRALAEQGSSIFMATHDIFNAVNTADRIGIMRQGKLEHIVYSKDVSAGELQQLYMNTI
jgi:ABC-2 type transport system ATP-binding protein